MTTPTDDQYGVVQLGNPFSMALVCRRCGALIAYTGDEEGGARAVHNLFHDRIDMLLAAPAAHRTTSGRRQT